MVRFPGVLRALDVEGERLFITRNGMRAGRSKEEACAAVN